MAFLDKTAKARELQRRRSRSRERQSGEPAGGAAGAHEQAPNDPASSHEEPSGHPAKDAAATKKSRDVTFNDDHFLIFADVLAGHTAATAVEVGGLLGVKPESMKLWTSFLGYALLSAKDKSGLDDNRFPDAAKRALEFTNVDEYMEELLRQQDTLHAPARTRARQAVSLFAALEKVAASSGAWQEEAKKRLLFLADEQCLCWRSVFHWKVHLCGWLRWQGFLSKHLCVGIRWTRFGYARHAGSA